MARESASPGNNAGRAVVRAPKRRLGEPNPPALRSILKGPTCKLALNRWYSWKADGLIHSSPATPFQGGNLELERGHNILQARSMRTIVSKMLWALAMVASAVALHSQAPASDASKIAALNQEVQKDLQERQPQSAIPLLRQIVALDAGNVNAQANLGVLLFFQNQFQDAIPPLRSALQLQPDLWRIEALLGISEKRTGDLNGAGADLEKAFSHLDDPKIRIQAGLELLELASATGRLSQAASVVAKLEELDPQNPKIMFAGYEVAQQLMDQSMLAMTMAAPDSAEMHMMIANQYVQQGDRTHAIAEYRQALKLNPQAPGAHYELAEQLRQAQDPALNAEAEAEFKAAVATNQYDEQAWRSLGEVMADHGDFAAARQNYARALALQPHDADAETDMAKAMIAQHQNREAISVLEQAVKDDPTNLVAHYRLSVLYRQAGRKEDAEREMEQFRHYQDLKSKLSKVFLQLRGRNIDNPM
jgi:Flp pilus assembly protein TadD